MTKKELKKAVTIDSLRNQVADLNGLEKVYNVFGRLVTTPIEYRFVADAMIRGYLRNIGREKKWTWFDDLAVSEWFVANGTEPNAVLDTCAHAMKYWHESAESMAEFLFALSLKCNEHYERENKNWSTYYARLFYYCRDLVYEYYENDDERTGIVWRYLD